MEPDGRVTLLIVDDESPIREGLVECVRWDTLGIEIVGSAEDGKEALALFQRLKPDILLTDVVMPGLNGMELATKIRSSGEIVPRTIFMSAYQDVDYLKSAFKLDAVDYLLKPINIDELTQVVQRTRESIVSERIEREQQLQVMKSSAETRTEARRIESELLLRSFFVGRSVDFEEVAQSLRVVGMQLCRDALINVILIEPVLSSRVTGPIVGFTELTTHRQPSSSPLIEKRRAGFSRLLSSRYNVHDDSPGLILDFDFPYLIYLVQDPRGGYPPAERLSELLHAEGYSATVAIGPRTILTDSRNLRESYQGAQKVLAGKFVKGRGTILFPAGEGPTGGPGEITELEYPDTIGFDDTTDDFSTLRTGLMHAVVGGDLDMMRDTLDSIFHLFEASGIMVKQCTCSLCADLIFETGRRMGSIVVVDGAQDLVSDAVAPFGAEDITELKQICHEIFQRYCEWIKVKSAVTGDRYVRDAIVYIDRMYGRDISVDDIAECIGLSASRLHTIFKAETDMGVHAYLDRVRMERAKVLLADSNERISRVARRVGFQDAGYFSKRFKRAVGISPGEYRRQTR